MTVRVYRDASILFLALAIVVSIIGYVSYSSLSAIHSQVLEQTTQIIAQQNQELAQWQQYAAALEQACVGGGQPLFQNQVRGK